MFSDISKSYTTYNIFDPSCYIWAVDRYITWFFRDIDKPRWIVEITEDLSTIIVFRAKVWLGVNIRRFAAVWSTGKVIRWLDINV